MQKPKICITGGNGFIGSRVVRRLIEQGYPVRCLLRSTSKTDRIDDLEFETAIGDVLDADSLNAAMTGCDGVIHMACLVSWVDMLSGNLDEVAVKGTQNVLSAAKTNGNLRTVYISSITGINGTDSPELIDEDCSFSLTDKQLYTYGIAKNEAEALCQKAVADGLPVVIVNPGEVYGPNDRDFVTSGNLVDFANSNPVLVCSGGTGIVYVDDVAAGIVAAFEKGRVGERYILSGDNLTVKDLASLTLRILDQNKKIIVLPNGLISFLAGLGRKFNIPLPFEPAVIPYAIKYWYGDNTKARDELGVTFRSSEETLAPTLEWLRENGHIKESAIGSQQSTVGKQ